MRDMATGRARGFGFVEMETEDGATAAIEKFNNTELDGRRIAVNEARPMVAGGGGGGRFNRGGGGGGRVVIAAATAAATAAAETAGANRAGKLSERTHESTGGADQPIRALVVFAAATAAAPC